MSREHTTENVKLLKQAPSAFDDPFVGFYTVLRNVTSGLGFQNYSRFITAIFSRDIDSLGDRLKTPGKNVINRSDSEQTGECFRFSGTRAYDQLAEATSLFIGAQSALLDDCCGPEEQADGNADLNRLAAALREACGDPTEAIARNRRIVDLGLPHLSHCDVEDVNRRFSPGDITLLQLYSVVKRIFAPPDRPCAPHEGAHLGGGPEVASAIQMEVGALPPDMQADPPSAVLERSHRLSHVITFMQQLLENQAEVPARDLALGNGNCFGLLLCKLRCPPLVELIWSYWIEQGMLVQGMNALTLRFQNRRYPGMDGLMRCDTSPLRVLNNFLWGFIQKEPDRLSLPRRAYEYDHHYGLRLNGHAVPPMLPADSRTQFLEAFHRLLQEACRYYRTAMDTTMNADAFPALNCLRELHLILAEGAHNQFGDLPVTARGEMLMQQWFFARPEVKDFLGGRPGVPYPEAWMPHMETLRQMMGWADASIRQYRDLATYGEQILLSIRYLPWSTVTDSTVAAGWLTFWRPEVQAYVHAYRIVTGVDLSATDVPVVGGGLLTAQPADLIGQRRLTLQRGAAR